MMAKVRKRPLLTLLALVSGLVGTRAVAREIDEQELGRRTRVWAEERHHRMEAYNGMSNEQLGKAMADSVRDRTFIYYQRGYGVYIEYTASDGKVWMWFPGNTRVVHGIWGLRDFGGPRLCYKYFNSRNAVTGVFENTECIEPEQALSKVDVIDQRPGDTFALANDVLPYRKSKFDVPDWPAVSPH